MGWEDERPEPALAPDREIGSRVRAVRIRQGLSLRALSRDLAVSPGTMSQIETGKTRLSVVRLHEIATALGVTADALLTEPAHVIEDAPASADEGRRAVPQPTSGPVVTDWRVYGPLNFDLVLEAALAVFLRTGYHGASVRDIARECGFSVSGIYHHYPSKQAMLQAILDLGITELLERAEQARAEGRGPVERFSLMIESLVLFHTHRREVGFVGASEMRSLEPGTQRAIARRRMRQQRLIDEEALAASAAGDFRTPHPREAARAVVTMCTGIVQWFKPGGPLTPLDLVPQYVGFALDLMQADREGTARDERRAATAAGWS